MLAFSQRLGLLSSGIVTSLSSGKVFAVRLMLISSANILGEAPCRQLGKSIMYLKKKKKSNGPSILPWGTPQLTVRAVDSLPFTLDLWVRLQLLPGEHQIISWSIVSNAFLRSIKTTPFSRPLSMFTDQLFVASSKAVKVLWRKRNPDRGSWIIANYHLDVGTVGRR